MEARHTAQPSPQAIRSGPSPNCFPE